MANLVVPSKPLSGAMIAGIPEVDVEFAPTSVPLDAASYVRLTNRLRKLKIQGGRPRELDQFVAATMTATLDHQDRLLDSLNTASAWVSDVIPNRQFRVGVRVGGVYFPRFAGYIDSYPAAYDWHTLDHVIDVEASGISKLLARTTIPGSALELAVAVDKPTHWWHFDEAAGSTYALDAGYAPTPVPLARGTGGSFGATGIPTFDGGRTAGQFDGAAVGGLIASGVAAPAAATWSVEAWFRIPTTYINNGQPPPVLLAINLPAAGTTNQLFVGLDATNFGCLDVFCYTSAGIGTLQIFDTTHRVDGGSGPHHLVFTYVDSTRTGILYLDGVQIATAAAGSGSLAFPSGAIVEWGGAMNFVSVGNSGVIAMQSCAIYDGQVLTAAQVAKHYTTGILAFSGFDTGAMASLILDYVGAPYTPGRAVQTGSSLIGAYELPGGSALDFLNTLADTELGQACEGLDGVYGWRARRDSLTASRSKFPQAVFGNSPFAYRALATMSTTALSTAVTGISPVLTAADVGAPVSGYGIRPGTTIAAQAGATATLSQSALLTVAGNTTGQLGTIPFLNVKPVYDESRLWNDVTMKRPGGTAQRLQDLTSQRLHGPSAFPSRTNLMHINDNYTRDAAKWVLDHWAYPQQRFSEVVVDVQSAIAVGAAPQLLSRKIGDRVTLWVYPTGSTPATPYVADYVIEGYQDEADIGSYVITFEIDSAETKAYAYWDDAVSTWDGALPWGF